ncbi:MAG: hypothetical protein V3U92_10860 [Cellulophaga sp.]
MDTLLIKDFKKRVNIIKNDILKGFIESDDYKTVSFYQVLNRLIILAQSNICFILYKKLVHKDHEEYTKYYEFLQDSSSDGIADNNSKIIENDLEKYLFNIHGSIYYIAVFRITKSLNNDSVKVDFIKIIDENKLGEKIYYLDDYISLCCRYVLMDNDKGKSDGRYKELIVNSIKDLKKESFGGKPIVPIGSIRINFTENNILKEFNQTRVGSDRNNDNYISLEVNRSFNYVYRKIKKAVLFIDNKNNYSPNIFFNIRNYNIKKNRNIKEGIFSGYDYNINYIVPIEQEKDLQFFLKEVLNNKKNIISRQNRYSDYIFGNNKKEALEIDNKFWEILEKKDGKEKLISCMREKFSNYARSSTDRVYSDGLLTFYMPFEIGGLRRISGSKESDKLKVVMLYYFSLIALNIQEERKLGIGKNQNIALIIYPIMINNTVWATLSHFIVMNDTDNSFKNNSLWFDNYHYLSVAIRAERLLRMEIKNIYLTWLGNMYLINFRKFIKGLIIANTDSIKIRESMKKLEIELEHSFYELTLFFPYSHIKPSVFHRIDRDKLQNEVDFLGKGGTIKFSKERNPFYPNIEKPELLTSDVSVEYDVIPVIEVMQKRVEDEIEFLLKNDTRPH